MDDKKLELGNSLKKSIDNLKDQLRRWEKATQFSYSEFPLACSDGEIRVETKNVNFDVMKALAISSIQKGLADLQKQYDAL